MDHAQIAVDPRKQFFQCMEHFDSVQHMFSTFFSALIHPCFLTAPDGMLPPRLSSATPTSLQVVWSTPVRNNAPGLPSYQLQMRPKHSPDDIQEYANNELSIDCEKESKMILGTSYLKGGISVHKQHVIIPFLPYFFSFFFCFRLFSKPSASLNYIVTSLQPYTTYEMRVIACNGYGETYSDWTPMVTAEDSKLFVDLHSSFLLLLRAQS